MSSGGGYVRADIAVFNRDVRRRHQKKGTAADGVGIKIGDRYPAATVNRDRSLRDRTTACGITRPLQLDVANGNVRDRSDSQQRRRSGVRNLESESCRPTVGATARHAVDDV